MWVFFLSKCGPSSVLACVTPEQRDESAVLRRSFPSTQRCWVVKNSSFLWLKPPRRSVAAALSHYFQWPADGSAQRDPADGWRSQRGLCGWVWKMRVRSWSCGRRRCGNNTTDAKKERKSAFNQQDEFQVFIRPSGRWDGSRHLHETFLQD